MRPLDTTKITNSIWAIILLGLLLIYQLKEIVYPTGVISVSIALAELLICTVFLIMTFFSENVSGIGKALMYVVGIVFLSYILSEKVVMGTTVGVISTFSFFREFCGAVMPFFAFYSLSRRGEINLLIIKTFFVLSFIIAIIVFFHTIFTLEHDEMYMEELTINASYRFVYLLPYVGLFKKNWGFLFLAPALILAILSAKRGAILCVAVNFIIYTIYSIRQSKEPLKLAILITVLFAALSYAVLYIYRITPYLQFRLENTLAGSTSGRDIILSKLWHYYLENTGVVAFLLGYGFCATVNIAGIYAHNDWMEFLIDTGLVGFASLVVFTVFLFGILRRNAPDNLTRILLVASIFIPTLFSMMFFNEDASSAFILLGYVIGSEEYMRNAAIGSEDSVEEPACWNF